MTRIKIAKQRKPRRRTPEADLQKAIVAHLNLRAVADVFWFHPPNGGWRSKREGAMFKVMGVIPGVPDLCFLHKGQFFTLELKAAKSRGHAIAAMSEAQRDVQRRISRAGGWWEIAYSLDDALRTLKFWSFIR